ncbi:hypothetical protein AB1L88_15620 [Tautonia sp. JC769]|uniref:hypothetical protein n=1 Tax=Tautonia sp. JC769 TaxID=3232135 RepID=UPI00345B243F
MSWVCLIAQILAWAWAICLPFNLFLVWLAWSSNRADDYPDPPYGWSWCVFVAIAGGPLLASLAIAYAIAPTLPSICDDHDNDPRTPL